MVFDATFNNISVIAWQSVLLVEETGVPGENHSPVTSQGQTLSYNIVSYTLFVHIDVSTHGGNIQSCCRACICGFSTNSLQGP